MVRGRVIGGLKTRTQDRRTVGASPMTISDEYDSQYCDATFGSVSRLNEHRENEHESEL